MPSEEQQNSPEEEQSLPAGADLLAEQIKGAEEQIRRIQWILNNVEQRRFDVLLFPSNIPLVTHGLGLLMDFEERFIENSRRALEQGENKEN